MGRVSYNIFYTPPEDKNLDKGVITVNEEFDKQDDYTVDFYDRELQIILFKYLLPYNIEWKRNESGHHMKLIPGRFHRDPKLILTTKTTWIAVYTIQIKIEHQCDRLIWEIKSLFRNKSKID